MLRFRLSATKAIIPRNHSLKTRVNTIRYRFLRRLQRSALSWIAASAALQLHGQGTVEFTNLGLGSDVVMGTPITVGTTPYAVGSKAPARTIFSLARYSSPD